MYYVLRIYSDPEELALDLSNSSREKVDSVVKDVLSKRGMNHLEPLENLGIKFNVSWNI